MNNPFEYGKAVRGYQFYDRRKSCDELATYLRDGSTNVVLYAPRRYGKTSMVVRVLECLKSEGFDCLLFDISKVSTVEKFCEAYATALHAVYGGFSEVAAKVTQYLLHLHPTISVGTKGVSVRFDYGSRMNEASLTDILDLAEKLATDAGRPLVVAFDEFQDVVTLSSTLRMEAIFRSAIQTHRKVRYVFFGSKTHLMKRMFGAASRPFYRSALTMKLPKPPQEETVEFISSRFADSGMAVEPQAMERILEVSENIPYYVQALSGLAFMSVCGRSNATVTVADVNAAAERLTDSNADLYAEIVRNLPASQCAVVSAVAEESVARLDESYRQRHGLPGLSTVHSALRNLVERGLVEADAHGYSIGDPIFARYLREVSASIVP